MLVKLRTWKMLLVALRKESVDRNIPSIGTLRNTHNVALRKESVDRNSTYVARLPRAQVSLSVRRAWIEIASSLLVYLALIRRSP